MRDAPVLRRRIAEETTLDLVVRPAAGHALERVLGHASQLGIRPQHRLLEEQKDRIGLGELRRAAETPVLLVIGGPDGVEDEVDQVGFELARASGHSGGGSLARLQHAARHLCLVGPVVIRDAQERARHLVGRHVCGAGEDVARRRQECGAGPAAHVVALVDIRPDVVVDADRHVFAIDEIDHGRM